MAQYRSAAAVSLLNIVYIYISVFWLFMKYGCVPLRLQAACSGSVDVARLLVESAAPINHHTIKYITQEVLEAQVWGSVEVVFAALRVCCQGMQLDLIGTHVSRGGGQEGSSGH